MLYRRFASVEIDYSNPMHETPLMLALMLVVKILPKKAVKMLPVINTKIGMMLLMRMMVDKTM